MTGLSVDVDQLLAFENRLNPGLPEESRIHVLGHGKFSTVFQLEGLEAVALKRLPPFPTAAARAFYERALNIYHMLLGETIGLDVVDQCCIPLTNKDDEHILYIAQARQPDAHIGHRVLQHCTEEEARAVLEAILHNVLRVWYRNEIEKELDVPGSLTGLDAQIANWAVTLEDGRVRRIVYLDTGTPFFRRLGRDRLEPDVFLASVPATMSWLVRRAFVQDVLDRYYDLRLVLIDMLASFYEADLEARVPQALEVVNDFVTTEAADLYIAPVARAEVEASARKDAYFWRRFLRLARVKRFCTTRLLRQKYNFMLPG